MGFNNVEKVRQGKFFEIELIETDKKKAKDKAEEIAKNNNWIQDSDRDSLSEFVKQAISKYPEKVEEYKDGELVE